MERWRFKNLLKKVLIYNCIIEILFFFSFIIIKTEINIIIYTLLLYFMIFCLIPIIILSIIYLVTNKVKKNTNTKEYYREIENMYPPAMVSYLIDNYIEKKEAILATILNLSIRKYLNIKQGEHGVIITENEQESKKIYKHEEYIINTIRHLEKIDLYKFYYHVIQDCIKEELIYRKEGFFIKSLLFIRWLLSGVGVIGSLIILICNLNELALHFLILIILAYVGKFVIKEYKMTSKGVDVAEKTQRLKNYLRDYTLIREKDYDYIEILDRYIPYAIALGEANKIEDLHIQGNEFMKDILKDKSIVNEIFSNY